MDKVRRNAVICFKGNEVNYPIEFAIKPIFAFDGHIYLTEIIYFTDTIHISNFFNPKQNYTIIEAIGEM